MINLIKRARDTNDNSVQKCRIGLDNDVSTSTLIKDVQNLFVTNYLASLTTKRQLLTNALTCTDLNYLSSSLNSITAADLSKISTEDFLKCQILLGDATNEWSGDRLAALVSKTKEVYANLSSISDSNIAELNSIFLGFDSSNLAELRFNTLSSISALGDLETWTSDQVIYNYLYSFKIMKIIIKIKNEYIQS